MIRSVLFLIFKLFWLTLAYHNSVAENRNEAVLTGKIRDQTTQKVLADAKISIFGQIGKNTTSGPKGEFSLSLPTGSYSLQVTHPNYQTVVRTDLVATIGRNRPLVIELSKMIFLLDQVEATPNFFLTRPNASTSSYNFSFEEIRRSAGGAEDIHRVMRALPGIFSTSDGINALVVRGGHPRENLTLLDGIEIPNSNHFGDQGTSSGGISMINLDFVRECSFYTGGFPAKYGDKLSSVMDIKFRDGNKDRWQADIYSGFAGFGAMVEGPLFSQKGSWMASARRSYLDLLVDVLPSSLSVTAIPNYSDFQAKITYDLSNTDTIDLIGIGGSDKMKIKSADDNISRGFDTLDYNNYQYTLGLKWQRLFSQKGYSTIILSRSSYRYLFDGGDSVGSGAFTNDSWEGENQLKGEINYDLTSQHQLQFGASAKTAHLDYRYESRGIDLYNNETGQLMRFGRLDVNEKEITYKLATYIHYTMRPLPILDMELGLRSDYFALTSQQHLSPRMGLSSQVTSKSRLNLAYGVYYQTPPYFFILWDHQNRYLKDLKSTHYVTGLQHLLRTDLLFSVEVYWKQYADYPVPINNEMVNLSNNGSGWVTGIDLFLHKKLTRRLYGRASYTYSRSSFETPERGKFVWDFDIPHIFSINGGYKFSNKFEFSLQWRYLSGRPYTPIIGSFESTPGSGDWEAIYDTNANSSRLDSYHSLDLRIDRRFQFDRCNLIAYLDVSNVYNRQNIWSFEWLRKANEKKKIYQFGVLPIFGFHLEF